MPILDHEASSNRQERRWIVAVAAAAIVMGLPTLRGSFVGGDDHRLVLNHVLVNRPSFEHALQLFTIVHRDLYQPLPLLTFSFEFLVAKSLGLFNAGAEGGAWFFHLTNILLHALNSVLVLCLLRRMHARSSDPAPATLVAGVAALLFAVHPFQVETVAWVNGRMMLLSTLFALLAALALIRWLHGGGSKWAALVVVCTALSAISKVRAPLVLLLALVACTRGIRPPRRFWVAWIPAVMVTAFFVWINVGATARADLFTEGAEHLRGPRLVRVILAIAFYFGHLVWPVGLTSYYPTPPLVSWGDARTWGAMLKVLAGCGALAFLARRSVAARWGSIWFFVSIADTLPFFPARNVLAADRYMYLPIIGLLWALAGGAVRAHAAWGRHQTATGRRVPPTVIAAVLLPPLIGVSWSSAQWYNTSLLKTLRVAECFPVEPRVWEMTGWCYHQLGDYTKAIECAEKELRHEGPLIRSGAYQLMGMSRLKLGQVEEALALLRKAIETDPTNDMGSYRLAVALDDLGRYEEAAAQYEEAARTAPGHNPTLHKLAAVYRKLRRDADARLLYERQLINNAYEVNAVLGLVELDLADGSREALSRAKRRLRDVLKLVRDHAPAKVSLGVVLFKLGRKEDAMNAYLDALRDEPGNPVAATNLAQLALAGDDALSSAITETLCDQREAIPSAAAACAYARLLRDHHEAALDAARVLTGGGENSEARGLLLAAIERFDQTHSDNPWSIALAAQTLIQDGNRDAASAFLRVFADRCKVPECAATLQRLKKQAAAPLPPPPQP